MKHSEEHYELFFGANSAYYNNVLAKMNDGKLALFNIYACLFGLCWMLYRKMYRTAGIVLVIIIIQAFIEQLLIHIYGLSFLGNIEYRMAIMLLIAIAMGFSGNYFYIKQSDRKISKILEMDLTTDETNQKLLKYGGTSSLSVVLFFLFWIVLISLTRLV